MAIGLTLELLIALACKPLPYWWGQFSDPTGKLGHCTSFTVQTNSSYTHGAVTLAVDVILGIVIPIHLLSALKMRIRTKATAGVLLSIGSL